MKTSKNPSPEIPFRERNTMSTSITKRVVAAIGAVALGAIVALGTAAPANADPGNINTGATRTLTVHKHTKTAANGVTPGTGQQITDTSNLGAPISGVTFNFKRVPDANVNLATNQGWQTAATATVAQAQAWTAGVTGTNVVTGANGLAVLSNPDIALYLVTETAYPGTVTNPSAPFLVTVPFPTGSAGTPTNDWIYDVHVYPKNAVTGLTKTKVAPANATEALNADLVRWNVDATIPATNITGFTITDTVDKTLLPFLENGTAAPGGVGTIATVTSLSGVVSTTFIAGTDYNITYADGTGNTRIATLAFTSAGFTKLNSFPAGKVTFSVLTRILPAAAGQTLTNNASSTVNGATNTTSSAFATGALQALAYAPSGNGGTTKTPLAGAVYELYPTQADADAGTNKIVVNGVTNWTTGANGLTAVIPLAPGSYYLKETTAPTGYQTPATIATPVVAGTVSTTAPRNYYEVPHTQQVPAWTLPLTGGDGALWFLVGGGALVAVALGAAIVVARRRAHARPVA
jgi:LPXTG-motif cell wall-anchored protein